MSWDKVIWARASIPRHAFISWVYVQHRLPTKMRITRFVRRYDLQCLLCNTAAKDDTHLFMDCPFATKVRNSLIQWWPLPFHSSRRSHVDMPASLSAYKAPKAHKQISYATFSAGIYFICYARNQLLFKNHRILALQTVSTIKDQISYRILFPNSLACTYSKYIDDILS